MLVLGRIILGVGITAFMIGFCAVFINIGFWYLAAICLLIFIASIILSMKIFRKIDDKYLEETPSGELLARYKAKCADDETIRAICRTDIKGKGHYVLTDKRIIINKGDSWREIAVEDVTDVRMTGLGRGGEVPTNDPARALKIYIKAGKSGNAVLKKVTMAEEFYGLADEISKTKFPNLKAKGSGLTGKIIDRLDKWAD